MLGKDYLVSNKVSYLQNLVDKTDIKLDVNRYVKKIAVFKKPWIHKGSNGQILLDMNGRPQIALGFYFSPNKFIISVNEIETIFHEFAHAIDKSYTTTQRFGFWNSPMMYSNYQYTKYNCQFGFCKYHEELNEKHGDVLPGDYFLNQFERPEVEYLMERYAQSLSTYFCLKMLKNHNLTLKKYPKLTELFVKKDPLLNKFYKSADKHIYAVKKLTTNIDHPYSLYGEKTYLKCLKIHTEYFHNFRKCSME